MALIFTFLKKYRIASCVALSMMLIELVVELLQPWIISKIIDEGIRQQNAQVVWMWGGILTGGALLAFAGGVFGSFYASHASQGVGYDLRDRLYRKLESLSYAAFSRFAVSSLITRLTGDVTQLQETIFMSLRFMSRVPLIVIGSVIMSLLVHFKLGLLLTVMVPILIVILTIVMKRAALLYRSVQRRLDKVNGVIQENLSGIRLIRVFVRMRHEMGRFAEHNRNLMQGTMSALRFTETTMPFVLFLMNLGIIGVLWLGKADIATGDATIGEVVAVINYMLRTIGALSALSWIVSTYSRAGASAQRIGEVLYAEDLAPESSHAPESSNALANSQALESSYAPRSNVSQNHAAVASPSNGDTPISEAKGTTERSRSEIEPASAPIVGDIAFEEVSFSYPGSDLPVLLNISFQAKAGQRIAIMGATGSGKTSLVQLIPRLYEENSGVVRMDGYPARELDVHQVRGSIGYVPQEVLLFSGSVRDNIAWGNPAATAAEIELAARQAQIHETIERLPQGYDTMIGQKGVNLSGGQKQRLSIARALVRKPAILILDDSTSALDVQTENALLQELKELACTTILITQKVSSTASADLILLLDEGRLMEKGSHQELMERSSLYRTIYDSQHEEEGQHVQGIR